MGLKSKEWHSVGWWYRVISVPLSIAWFYPEHWIAVVINPAVLFKPLYGIPLTLTTLLFLDYWIYNWIINKYNGWPWNYLGKKKYGKFWYASGFAICGTVMLALMIIGIVDTYFHEFALNYKY